MNCEDRAELTPLYLSGELDAARAAAFGAHLAACERCAQEMDQFAEIDARLREEILREPANVVILEARIARRMKRAALARAIVIAGAVAAMLVVGATGYAWHAGAALLAEAAQDHHREVVDRERRVWVTDAGAAETLAGRAGVAERLVSALAPAGYHFERAKLCRLGKTRFLHLVYSDGAREFSLFLAPRRGLLRSKIQCADHGSDHVAAVQAGDVEALIVSEESGGDAFQLARAAASVI